MADRPAGALSARLSALQNSPQNVQFPFTPMRNSRLHTSIREESGLMSVLKRLSLPVLSQFALVIAFSAPIPRSIQLRPALPDNRIESASAPLPISATTFSSMAVRCYRIHTLSLDIDHTNLGVTPKYAPQKNAPSTRPSSLPSARNSPKFASTTMNSASIWTATTPSSSAPTTKAPATASKLHFLSSSKSLRRRSEVS